MSDLRETTLHSILFKLLLEITIKMKRSKVVGATNIDRIYGYSEIMNENSKFQYSKEC